MTHKFIPPKKAKPNTAFINRFVRFLFHYQSSLPTIPIVAILLLVCFTNCKHKSFQLQDKTRLPDSIQTTANSGSDPYTFTLPDKSELRLEASTVVSFWLFPHDGIPRNRIYTLKGQARFRVYPVFPGKLPTLFVETQRMEIRVLDTFNMSNFIVRDVESESNAFITALSGKIFVSSGKDSAVLVAGQLASVTKNSTSISVISHLPIIDSAFQKSELFDFSQATVPQAMDTIRRWYGLYHVQIEPGIDTVSVGILGSKGLPRDESLKTLLQMVSSDDIDFKVIGNTIKVCKKDAKKGNPK
jgi:hypothetical protein